VRAEDRTWPGTGEDVVHPVSVQITTADIDPVVRNTVGGELDAGCGILFGREEPDQRRVVIAGAGPDGQARGNVLVGAGPADVELIKRWCDCGVAGLKARSVLEITVMV